MDSKMIEKLLTLLEDWYQSLVDEHERTALQPQMRPTSSALKVEFLLV